MSVARAVLTPARTTSATRRLGAVLDRPAVPTGTAVVRLRQVAVCLLLVVVAFGQAPGRVSPDTKLDLTVDPGRWLADALRVWSPDGLGALQNQAFGYLFPMGPFYEVGLAAGLPAWVVQRLWWSVLLIAAFLGVVRLAERLGIGTPAARLLAGLAYALSPRVVTELGALSSEVLPLAVLPWLLVPLVGPQAELRPRRAAARSGVALLCAGAVNAAATVAVLPLPAIWLLAGLHRRGGRRLAGWWATAVLLASLWWVVPLLVQGQYAAPFLDYIENAATTTLVTSPVEVLRGTSHWLAYLPGADGRPWWRAGWTLVTVPSAILNSAVVAALGVAGLCSRSLPARRRLSAAALLAAGVMVLGHVGSLDSPLADWFRGLLDGPLAPLRNVHKLDPLLRLPIALGLCHVLSVVAEARPRRLLAVVAGIAVVGTAAPALAGRLPPTGSYTEIPGYWRDTAAWIDRHAGSASTLLVPAAGDAQHLWGRPLDDPLQALATKPVVVRDAVPLGGPEITRLLDAVEVRLDSGEPSPGLAQVLARAGIRYVVVRNDLDRIATGAPRPVLVAQALAGSPGIRRVRAFGPPVGSDAIRRGFVADRGLDQPRPAVEIYQVAGAGSPVAAYARAAAWRLDGGPDALLQLADRGLLGPDQAVVEVGDGDAGPGAVTVVADSLRRRSYDVGRARQNWSPTLTADEPRTGAQLPGVADNRLAAARWTGVRNVRASSSAADLDALTDRRLDAAAGSAVDGDPATAWWSSGLQGPVGQWLQVELATPTDLRGLAITTAGPVLSAGLARLTEVEVRTDAGSLRTRLTGAERSQVLRVPPGRTSTLRVTVTAVRGGDPGARLAGIRELTLPRITVGRTVVLPAGAPPGSSYLLDAPPGGRDGCLATPARDACSPDLVRGGEEPGSLDRTLQLPAPAVLPVSGWARPTPGPQLDAVLDNGAPVRVTASSRAVTDPRGRPATILDGDPGTGWTAADGDRTPWLELRWAGVRTVDRVRLVTGGLTAAKARRVRVQTEAGTVQRDVPSDGRISLPPSRTDFIRISVLAKQRVTDVSPTGRLAALPVGFAEVTVPGLADLPRVARDAPVAFACGQGPTLRIAGAAVQTSLRGTRADLLGLRPLRLQPCTPGRAARLVAGENRVTADRDARFAVVSLTIGAPALSVPPARVVQVQRWDAEHRSVRVGPGGTAWLTVHQNLNNGWHAELDGHRLRAARVDGWQQAFLLPEGAGGVVQLVYGPGDVQRAGLAAGVLAVLVLLLLATLPSRRRVVRTAEPLPARPPAGVTAAVPLLLLVLLAGAVGGLIWGLAAAVNRWAARRLPLLAGAATVAAGAVVAWAPWAGARAPGAFRFAATAPALLALALLAVRAAEQRRVSAPPGASGAAPAPPPGAG